MKCLLKQVWISLFLLAAMPLWAENYPYRSDVLWVTVPDHADWLYETGEKAKVEVQFYKYGIPQDGLEVAYERNGYIEEWACRYLNGYHESAGLFRLPPFGYRKR